MLGQLKINEVITRCCILHNMCIDLGDTGFTDTVHVQDRSAAVPEDEEAPDVGGSSRRITIFEELMRRRSRRARSQHYPIYRRTRDDRSITKANGIALDNIWVVPQNIYLCTKYDAHINVEICNTVSAVKYLYNYVYKGHDRASVQVSSDGQQNSLICQDEINRFIDARYVSAPEAIWRIFGFSLHKEFPAHQRLTIHLPGQEMVYFSEDANCCS
ncbi:hypothetical protein INT47_006630 [Mucor saturninus]|uniref:Uncharacterized protein n=1 Tax=Mucor saturninus TaxID=64648 RepID=A0A8H7UTZ7_9FUNG|nr:hypothetical protein INT47_006630 [Mucor saturninus]